MKFGLAALFVTFSGAYYTAGNVRELRDNMENGTKNVTWQNQIKLFSTFKHGPSGPVPCLKHTCMVLENGCVIDAAGKLYVKFRF
jgi:hypothetical protein